jgi:hypothetical protein
LAGGGGDGRGICGRDRVGWDRRVCRDGRVGRHRRVFTLGFGRFLNLTRLLLAFSPGDLKIYSEK